MNELLRVMARDMKIHPYEKEPMDSFEYRVCYSALGQWCLRIGGNISNGVVGTSKNNLTQNLNDLIDKYSSIFPGAASRLTASNGDNLAVFIRTIYEQTGYLWQNEDSSVSHANSNRMIKIGDSYLTFSYAPEHSFVNGLGVYEALPSDAVDIYQFLLRDRLPVMDYIHTQYDEFDFTERDFNIDELEFFDPKLPKPPSKSWEKQPTVPRTIARKGVQGSYFRVLRNEDNQFLYSPIEPDASPLMLCGEEVRRLYIALKAYYRYPALAWVTDMGEEYVKLRTSCRLPNREYFLLMLCAWPSENAFTKHEFIIRKEMLNEILCVLQNIGLQIRR